MLFIFISVFFFFMKSSLYNNYYGQSFQIGEGTKTNTKQLLYNAIFGLHKKKPFYK